MFVLGIDIGYSSVKTVLIDEKKNILKRQYGMHHGEIDKALKEQVKTVQAEFNLSELRYISITGSGAEYLAAKLKIKRLNEVTALMEGVCSLEEDYRSVIEIGGESAKYITNFTKEDKSSIRIAMNSNCAAGTGSFIEEQVNRLNIELKDYSAMAERAESVPRIAGRCSVFAKTDIIHHQQEGIPSEEILKGLSYALVRNYKSAVVGRGELKGPVLFVGGVTKNTSIKEALKDVFALSDESLHIHDLSECMTAFGCAVMALNEQNTLNNALFFYCMNNEEDHYDEVENSSVYKSLEGFGLTDYSEKHFSHPEILNTSSNNCYLGIDIGSTSTNVVLMSEERKIIDYLYLRTAGDPQKVLMEALSSFGKKYDGICHILGVGITGSGRYMIGRTIGADLIVDEITAQARAAVAINPDVDTIFEIGGQDSKYISIKNGVVVDFQMNKICAAGTGSFIEEQSLKFNIPVESFGKTALNGKNPVNLGERCTVFIESSIASALSKGIPIQDIASGLCYSIVRNYLDRVVGNRKIGNKIFLQGGIAWNQGVLNAFKAVTGKEIIVPEYFSITGAYGAAILSGEKMREKTCSEFKGFFLNNKISKENRNVKMESEIINKFTEYSEKILFKTYDGAIDEGKKTVGIPRGLFTYGMYSMFYTFFKILGFNVILSDNTSEKTIQMAQQYSLDETCYPLKLMNGHVAELVEKEVDYIFFPDLYSVDHPGSESRQNMGCPYMQLAFKMIRKSMNLDEKNIPLLSPTIAFSFGKKFMSDSFMTLGRQLGRSDDEINKALHEGMKAFVDFEERLEAESERVMKEVEGEEKVFVIVSKLYGAVDPVLNMGIPDRIEKMGYKVLPFYNLPETELGEKYTNMFWPFGQHIIEPAKWIANTENMYAILLTHHGCGPDSVLSHYFKTEMGEKPYLHIEVDEHSSKVGVITRIEAFVNSLNSAQSVRRESVKIDLCKFGTNVKARSKSELSDFTANEKKVYLPPMHPYSEIFSAFLKQSGVDAEVIEPFTSESIDMGKRFMLAEEYFTTTALLGSVLKHMKEKGNDGSGSIYCIPRNEGADVDGQYADFILDKISPEHLQKTEMYSPFLEDIIYSDNTGMIEVLTDAILLGDMVRLAPLSYRKRFLDRILRMIRNDRIDVNTLKKMAEKSYTYNRVEGVRKSVMIVGDPMLLFNDGLNNYHFEKLERENIRVVYTPLSEYLMMFWKDHAEFNAKTTDINFKKNITILKEKMCLLSERTRENSNFDSDYDRLKRLSDELIGYYSGMNGRYRYAKIHSGSVNVDGFITVSSLYENTGIMLNILKHEKQLKKPVLNLTFDGNHNENDKMKIDSFVYYL
jgi:predicted CoA-substrate-specific enzyme activase